MFGGCIGLEKLNLNSWDTDQVTKMQYMFNGTKNLKPIFVGENWLISESTTVTGMFDGSKTNSANQLCKPDSTHEWCIVN